MVDRAQRLVVRHPVTADALVAAVLLIMAEVTVVSGSGAVHGLPTAIAVALVASGVAMRRPLPVLAAGLFFTAVSVGRTAGGDLSRVGVGWAAIIFIGYGVGAHASPRAGRIALALLIASMTIVYVSVAGNKSTAPSEWLWELGFAVAPYTVGRLLRARRRLQAELEDRALGLVHEREQRERLAVRVERARIARELHDVAAHSLSLMVVQAGAARSVLEMDLDGAARAFEAIARTGRQTIADMGRLLGFLDTDDTQSLGGISRIGDLVAQARQAGLPVEVNLTGTARRLPSQVDLVAYRVIQEGLTNALRHAGGARTQVLVAYDDAAVRIEVSNDGQPRINHPLRSSGAGRGLQGMRERVEIVGGELTTGTRPDGGWAVTARLPLHVGAADVMPGQAEVAM